MARKEPKHQQEYSVQYEPYIPLRGNSLKYFRDRKKATALARTLHSALKSTGNKADVFVVDEVTGDAIVEYKS